MAAGVEMTAGEFRLISELFHRYAGLHFNEDKRYLLERRLAPRLDATGARSFSEYARLLRTGSHGRRELEEAVDRVTVNETYFFREEYQLRAFAEEILPELRAEKDEKVLSLWSAGCASGEEAYTISMLLVEQGGFRDWDVRIVGTDISRRVLRQASQARYRDSALRSTSALRRDRFFRRAGNLWEVREDVRAPVAFARLNLVQDEPLELVGDVDVLFCRNVLIYFDAAVRRRVVQSFYDRLAPGGYLLLGHSETLLNLPTDFELVQLENDTVYRKPGPPRRSRW